MKSAFRLNVDSKGIARLIFDCPDEKVNKFSMDVLDELDQVIDGIAKNSNIKALLITSAKEDVFIAGADLHTFEKAFDDPSIVERLIKKGHRIFSKLENLPFPSIAVIHGACLGGGLEFALACTYRIVTDHPKTLLGLPEVTLGIFPGWGGTQRLPRLVGLLNGLDMILTGKSVKAIKAWKMKLADAIISREFQEIKVEEFIDFCLSEKGRKEIKNRRKPSGMSHHLLENNPLGRKFVFYQARKDVLKKTKGHYPAPLIVLRVIEETYSLPLQVGLAKEVQIFLESQEILFTNAKHLIQLFFISEALKKQSWVPEGTKVTAIRSAAVLGAGIMGSGIAWLLTNRDIPVRLKDISWDILGKGVSAVNSIYEQLLKIKKLTRSEASLKFHKLSATIDYSGFRNADLIIEAAVENLDLKKQILKELEQNVSDRALISTNTSSLTVTEMAAEMRHPERFVAMHFFNPVNRMPLVEVVAGVKTSPETVASAVDICKKLGKTPIVVGDCPGFLVNRIFVLGAAEVLWMLQEGVEMKVLERVMLDFGMPMDPFTLADEVGNDVSYKVMKTFEKAYGKRMEAPKIAELMYAKKLFGKKGGKGFFIYEGKEKKSNPEIKQLLSTFSKSDSKPTEQEMVERMMFIMVNEAGRCLQEKVISNPAYLDMALIMGIGFPPFRGGLLRYADEKGISYVVGQLKRFEEKYGMRFAPCDFLLEMDKRNKTFY